MKGHLNKYGGLLVHREGYGWTVAECTRGRMNCGMWCPLFGDVIHRDDGKTEIELCTKKLVFDEYTEDERDPPYSDE